jgi:transcriptional regulator with XRE-family HTH domain
MKLNILPHLTRQKMTQNALADKIGVRKGFMSEIISGKKSPSLETLRAIAGALDVPVGSLVDDLPFSTAQREGAPGMAEDASPFTHALPANVDPIRALYANHARNAAITHRAAVNLPGFGIVAGDLIVCDLSRLPTPGEVAIAVSIDTETGTAVSMIRRYAPPFLLGGDPLATATALMEQSGLDLRHPVIGIIRGTL